MQPPKSIIIKKPSNYADKAVDLPNVPKQQLVENNELVTEIITQEVVKDQLFVPKKIDITDLDNSFKTWVDNFNFELDGKKVPVYLFTNQRLSELIQTWGNLDGESQHPLPIITITKESPAKKGTYLNTVNAVLPVNVTFPLYRIPKVINGQTIYEYVEVSEPTYVDLQYKINLFSNNLREINKFNELILNLFKRNTTPTINVFGHNMEIKLNDISESHKREIEERRYYRSMYVIDMQAFIIGENDYVIKRSFNSIKMDIKGDEPKNDSPCRIETVGGFDSCSKCLVFNLNKKSNKTIEYKMTFDFNVTYDNQSNTGNNVSYFVNNVPVTIPFNINIGDVLKLVYNKSITKTVQIRLCGESL